MLQYFRSAGKVAQSAAAGMLAVYGFDICLGLFGLGGRARFDLILRFTTWVSLSANQYLDLCRYKWMTKIQ